MTMIDTAFLIPALTHAIIVGFAALIHGTIGIGFPLIATPLLARVTDVRTAILLLVLSNWRHDAQGSRKSRRLITFPGSFSLFPKFCQAPSCFFLRICSMIPSSLGFSVIKF